MKTILVYSHQSASGYKELALSMIREGRRRGWRFAWVTPRDEVDEPARVRRMFDFLKPIGFVGGAIRRVATVVPKGIARVWIDCGIVPPGDPHVLHDNASFGEAAADALADGGPDFAAFGFEYHSWSLTRMRAFARRIRASGGQCRTFSFPRESLDNAYLAFEPMLAALRKLPRPVSVFAVTDRLAEVALMAAGALGWRCPQDIRIVGVDDDEVLCMSAPTALSSVHPDWAEGGRLVVEALEAQMRGEPVRREYVYGAAGVTRRASTRMGYRRPKDERVERALDFIASEYASPSVGVPDVVAAMGCSRRLAELRFREETGRSIAEALTDARLDRAMVLLRRRNADIAALPGLCGFRTASALRVAFRRRMGMSMTAWRKANAADR